MGTQGGKTQADTLSVEELLDLVQSGDVRVPRFQRRFKWDQQDVIRLLDSIYRGYPVGTLLFWEKPAGAETLRFGGVTIEAPAASAALFVVDGQQRITALAGVLLNDPDGPPAPAAFQVAFDPESLEFVAASPEAARVRGLIPLGALRDFGRLMKWFQDSSADLKHQGTARHLLKTILGYRMTRYVIRDADEKTAREVFSRLNHTGKALTAVEVFTAAQSPDAPMDPAGLAQLLVEDGFGPVNEEILLQCILVARGQDPRRDKIEAALKAAADDALQLVLPAIQRAARFVLEAGCHSLALLPFDAQFICLARFFHLHPEPHPRNLILLRRWFWRDLLAGGFGGDRRTPVTFILANVDEDEDGSVQKLLQKAGRQRVLLAFPEKYDPRSAASAVCLMAMLAAAPEGETPVKVMAGVVGNLPRLVPRMEAGRETMGNRVLWAPPRHDSWLEWAVETQPAPSEDFLKSHLVPTPAWEALKAGNATEAAALRSQHLLEHVQRYADVLCEWDQEDRVPLRLDAGEEDGDSDEHSHRSSA